MKQVIASALLILCLTQTIYSACGPQLFTGTLTATNYQGLMDHHNTKRNDVANGKESANGTPLPKASDMTVLVWNAELAKLAQGWADKLVSNCKGIGHNPTRTGTSFSYLGENVYWSASTDDPGTPTAAMTKSSSNWYSEIADFPVSLQAKFASTSGPAIGHFTQQIWAATTDIGCGYAHYADGNWTHAQYVVCNYGVGGNMIGSPIYNSGTPCSKCATGFSCSPTYNGLCSKGGAATTTTSTPTPAPVTANSDLIKFAYMLVATILVICLNKVKKLI